MIDCFIAFGFSKRNVIITMPYSFTGAYSTWDKRLVRIKQLAEAVLKEEVDYDKIYSKFRRENDMEYCPDCLKTVQVEGYMDMSAYNYKHYRMDQLKAAAFVPYQSRQDKIASILND